MPDKLVVGDNKISYWHGDGMCCIKSMLQLPWRFAKRLALFALTAFFLVAGVNHFVNPDFYVKIMPPYLPAHLELVYLSGLFEILGGVAILAPGIRTLAGWGLILLLLAVLPANLHMALHTGLFPAVPAFVLYARVPLQFLLIGWVYWVTRPDVPVAAKY